jgi:hypothetical protein
MSETLGCGMATAMRPTKISCIIIMPNAKNKVKIRERMTGLNSGRGKEEIEKNRVISIRGKRHGQGR